LARKTAAHDDAGIRTAGVTGAQHDTTGIRVTPTAGNRGSTGQPAFAFGAPRSTTAQMCHRRVLACRAAPSQWSRQSHSRVVATNNKEAA
jgi:hypothetical protein